VRWLLISALAAVGCREATHVTTELATDADCGTVHGTAVTVGAIEEIEKKPAVASTEACSGASGDRRIGSFVVVPSGDKDSEFAIKVVTGIDTPAEGCVEPDYTGCIVARRSMRFIPHTALELPIALRGVCKDVPCTPTTTCVFGQCVDAKIPDPKKCETAGLCDEGILISSGAGAAGPGGAGGAGGGGIGGMGGGAGGAPPACANGGLDDGETDVDCGGELCTGCDNGKKCLGPTDCKSGECVGGICAACPADMTPVDDPAGGTYCVDRTEVMRAQYDAFVTAKAGDTTGQPPYCAWNNAYDMDPMCAGLAAVCQTGCDDHPVVCVDWCDAYAYCAWNGKRMCGAIGGASLAPASFADPAVSQWYNACSAGGTLAFPYGQSYDGKACNGADQSPTVDTTLPVGTLPGCEGGFPGIFDMSGNVWEWEDACNGQMGKTDSCRCRGAGFISVNGGGSGLECARDLVDKRNKTDAYTGIRCCKD